MKRLLIIIALFGSLIGCQKEDLGTNSLEGRYSGKFLQDSIDMEFIVHHVGDTVIISPDYEHYPSWHNFFRKMNAVRLYYILENGQIRPIFGAPPLVRWANHLLISETEYTPRLNMKKK